MVSFPERIAIRPNTAAGRGQLQLEGTTVLDVEHAAKIAATTGIEPDIVGCRSASREWRRASRPVTPIRRSPACGLLRKELTNSGASSATSAHAREIGAATSPLPATRAAHVLGQRPHRAGCPSTAVPHLGWGLDQHEKPRLALQCLGSTWTAAPYLLMNLTRRRTPRSWSPSRSSTRQLPAPTSS